MSSCIQVTRTVSKDGASEERICTFSIEQFNQCKLTVDMRCVHYDDWSYSFSINTPILQTPSHTHESTVISKLKEYRLTTPIKATRNLLDELSDYKRIEYYEDAYGISKQYDISEIRRVLIPEIRWLIRTDEE